MTPAARLAAAAALLDEIGSGTPAEKALTTWARRSRFAGSKDRAALRDIVFDILRRRRSCAAYGGGMSGRQLCLGYLRAEGEDPADWFTGPPYALSELSNEEQAAGAPPEGNAALDIPDWIAPSLAKSLSAEFEPICEIMRHRAPLDLRVNTARTNRASMQQALTAEGIEAVPHELASTALRVTSGARRVHLTPAYTDGFVEIQDAGAQAVCEAIDVAHGTSVLDFCAGGGGKSLALAARSARVTAHDENISRMADLSPRAARAGVSIEVAGPKSLPADRTFDVVVADVPCSGTGAWRRQVEAKWILSRQRLDDLKQLQHEILLQAASHVTPGGWLHYVTCSLLREENEDQCAGFLQRRGLDWSMRGQLSLSPLAGGDGFFLASFQRKHSKGE